MNNDITFEISKYIEKKTGNTIIDEAFESPEVLKQCKKNVAEYLNGKITSRPKKVDLVEKNILVKHKVNFRKIHRLLESIEFKESNNGISPIIANLAKKIDLEIRKKFLKRQMENNDL